MASSSYLGGSLLLGFISSDSFDVTFGGRGSLLSELYGIVIGIFLFSFFFFFFAVFQASGVSVEDQACKDLYLEILKDLESQHFVHEVPADKLKVCINCMIHVQSDSAKNT